MTQDNPVFEGSTIEVVVHYTDAQRIGRKRRTVFRLCRRYQRSGREESCLVRLHGQQVWAKRYPNTVWTVELSMEIR
jgi:hypothetical protein